MYSMLLAVIYLIFISLGLPDSLPGSGWPVMQVSFGVPSSYAMLFLFVVPYGLGAGVIDASVNHYVANNYFGAVINIALLERTYIVLKRKGA